MNRTYHVHLHNLLSWTHTGQAKVSWQELQSIAVSHHEAILVKLVYCACGEKAYYKGRHWITPEEKPFRLASGRYGRNSGAKELAAAKRTF